jgi:hypothetical protein
VRAFSDISTQEVAKLSGKAKTLRPGQLTKMNRSQNQTILVNSLTRQYGKTIGDLPDLTIAMAR